MRKFISIILAALLVIGIPLCSLPVNAYSEDPDDNNFSGGTYYIKNKKSGMYLDVWLAEANLGDNVVQHRFNGGKNQQWRFVRYSDGTYKIYSAVNPDRVLCVDPGTGDNYNNIEVWEDGNTTNKFWKLRPAGGPSYVFLSECSNFTGGLAVHSASNDNAANVIQHKIGSQHNDKWYLEPVSLRNRQLSYQYMKHWSNNNVALRSPTYPNCDGIGGDCTNFVSQCILAGGGDKCHFNDNWWVYKKTDSYPKPANTTELDASWELANKSAWISAPEFQKYWSSQVYCKTYKGQDILNNPSIVYDDRFYVGDAVQMIHNTLGIVGNAKHSYIISGTNANGTCGPTYLVSSHTGERDSDDLLSIIKNQGLGNYYFRFYCVL